MKSEWEFHFTTHGFRFDRVYNYNAKIEEKISLGGRDPEAIAPLIRIVPSDIEPFPGADQVGSMYILLPYSPNETRQFAFHLARLVAERTSFSHGDFRILGGLIACKRIPETPEEEADFGNSPYDIEVRLVEDLPPAKFDSRALQSAPKESARLPLIAQFNEAKRVSQPIPRFVGFFRIIESLVHAKNESRKLKHVLIGSTQLRRIYDMLETDIDFESFIERATATRHNCAHLKMDKDFGYTPMHAAVQSEVEPLLPILEALSRESIRHWTDAGP